MSKNKLILVVSVAIWLFLSLFPWQAWFGSAAVPNFILGLALFFVPGIFTFLLLSEDKNLSPRVLFGGFVVSIFGAGLL